MPDILGKDFGPLKVKGFTGGEVTSDFLEDAIRRSKEGQTVLLPGQYASDINNKEVSLAKLNLSRAMHLMESDNNSNNTHSDQDISDSQNSQCSEETQVIKEEICESDRELLCSSPEVFEGWSSKIVKVKNSHIKFVHVHKDTKVKHNLETYDLTDGVKVTYCHHLKVKYIIYCSDGGSDILESLGHEEK